MPRTKSNVFAVLTVADTPVRALQENPKRICWSAVNTSDTDVFFGHDQNVSTTGRTKGWPIRANYGAIEDEFSKDEVWIICAASDKEVIIQEVTEAE